MSGPSSPAQIPWVDPTQWGATGNGSPATGPAQDAINYAASNYGGCEVRFPPGYFYVPGGLIVPPGVRLFGCGIPPNWGGTRWGGLFGAGSCPQMGGTIISSQPYDNLAANNGVATISFQDVSSSGGGFHCGGIFNMMVTGFQDLSSGTNSVASAPAVQLGTSVGTNEGIIRDSWIIGGGQAIKTLGATDWRIENVHAAGYRWSVLSGGGNFYTDCKFDGLPNIQGGGAFQQCGAGSTAADGENQIENCDLSDPDFSYSLYIDDGATNFAETKIIGGTLSSPIFINYGAPWTAFMGCKMGGSSGYGGSPYWTVNCGNPVSIVGCRSLNPFVAMCPGPREFSGNFNIT